MRFFVIALAASTVLHAQHPPLATVGTIRGRAVAASGEPLRHARITISGPATAMPVFTDGDGRFLLADLQPGRYVVTAFKAGFVQTRLGAANSTEPPTPVDVSAGRSVEVELRMPRSGAIDGRLVDEFGDPIELAEVAAARIVRYDGGLGTVTIATAFSDDRGEYRLGALPEGRYVVIAGRWSEPVISTTTIAGGGVVTTRLEGAPVRKYYPGTWSLGEAQLIDVRAGEERTAIDFSVGYESHTPAVLNVAFVDEHGNPAPAMAVLVNAADPLGDRVLGAPFISDHLSMQVDAGEWLLLARGGIGSAAVVPITIGSSDLSVTMALTRAGSISGRIVSDHGPLPPSAAMEVVAIATDPRLREMPNFGPLARVRPNGEFDLGGLVGPADLRIRNAPPGWVVKSIRLTGREVLDRPIEIKPGEAIAGVEVVLTDRVAQVSGTLEPAPVGASVLVFPETLDGIRDIRRVARWVRPSQTGEFRVDDLLPGNYLVAAAQDVDGSQWANGDYLAGFVSRAVRVTLAAGEKRTIALGAER